MVSKSFGIYADGQVQPDHGAWTYVESLHFGVVTIPVPTSPPPVTTTATAHAESKEAAAAGSPTTAPAPAVAPAGTTTAQTTAEKKRTSPPASRRTQPGVGVIAEAHQPTKLGHGSTAGYVLGPLALGGVKYGNLWGGGHVRLKRGAAERGSQ